MSKITKSAAGEACEIRLTGVCTRDPEKVVYCHLNGAGMGMKAMDIHGAYGCSSCHDAIDGRIQTEYTRDELKLAHLEAVIRTQIILTSKGLINT